MYLKTPAKFRNQSQSLRGKPTRVLQRTLMSKPMAARDQFFLLNFFLDLTEIWREMKAGGESEEGRRTNKGRQGN